MLGPRGVGNELLSPALLQMEQVHVSQMVGHDARRNFFGGRICTFTTFGKIRIFCRQIKLLLLHIAKSRATVQDRINTFVTDRRPILLFYLKILI